MLLAAVWQRFDKNPSPSFVEPPPADSSLQLSEPYPAQDDTSLNSEYPQNSKDAAQAEPPQSENETQSEIETQSSGENAPYDYSQPVPQSGETLDNSYFDDALFVGDSITEGIGSYALMKNAGVVAFTGINTDTIMTREVIRNDQGELETMLEAASHYPDAKKIFVMLGANGIAWIGKESFVENYGAFLDALREQHPDADIFVESILPVTAQYETENEQITNAKIREYNQALLAMAQQKEYYYLDVESVFADENGCLPDEASPTDGMHFGPKYYEMWFDYLKCHAVDP